MTGAHRNREYLARQLDHARQVRGAAAQHDTRGQPSRSVSRPLEFAADELEDLVHALVDNVRHQLARRVTGRKTYPDDAPYAFANVY